MTKDIIAVSSRDCLQEVAQLFKRHKFHHLLVIDESLVGILSMNDYLLFKKGFVSHDTDKRIELYRHKKWIVKEIMTTKVATLGPNDSIEIAIEMFKANLFHAIPIVDDDDKPIGIVTPYDIMSALLKERIKSISC